MSERYVCIHGHFYQPPRQNPWTGQVEAEASAGPDHDWNQRITDECYAANAAARILDGVDGAERLVNNYGRISFNFGPMLLSWLERESPATYAAIQAGDIEGRERFGGHGPALAQAYGHAIMPLANDRDRRTQVIWGLRDFEHRFGRRPQGMWLPETAVDTATLEALAAQGIEFTLLAPHQARRQREPGGDWQELDEGSVDPRRAYFVQLPSGRRLSLCFYDGGLAHAVAFEPLLDSGEGFAERLVEALGEGDEPALVHIATDGETYGHHRRFGEMALAYALDIVEREDAARLTCYGQFLERHPPTVEVEIAEDTSWSCAHGVERWRSDCGCNSGGQPDWKQAWRGPLREALDWLRDTLAERFEAEASGLLRDPWVARDAYIEVVLEAGRWPDFLAAQGSRPLNEAEADRARRLLELQRMALLMYASDAWFYDDVSGLETVFALRHAGRAVDLAAGLWGESYEPELLARLAAAPSNLPQQGNGALVYRRNVRRLAS